VATAAQLRRHAEHCRVLADLTASPQDRQVLRLSADDFDADAIRVNDMRRAAAERRKSKA
jgi:hypothetical protein